MGKETSIFYCKRYFSTPKFLGNSKDGYKLDLGMLVFCIH